MVSSVGVISYGWDMPEVSCVILARPTTSVALHLQQIGRGARPAAGKNSLMVLDHAANTHRHGCYEDERQWSLNGMALQAKGEAGEGIYTCPKCRCQFRRGPVVCKFCGAPIVVKSREVKVVSGELEELQRRQMLLDSVEFGKPVVPEAWGALRASDSTMERKYKEWMQIAAVKGYKAGWAKMKFHAAFRRWPEQVFGKKREEGRAPSANTGP